MEPNSHILCCLLQRFVLQIHLTAAYDDHIVEKKGVGFAPTKLCFSVRLPSLLTFHYDSVCTFVES